MGRSRGPLRAKTREKGCVRTPIICIVLFLLLLFSQLQAVWKGWVPSSQSSKMAPANGV